MKSLWVVIAIMVTLTISLIAFAAWQGESETARQNRFSTICYFAMKRIGLALLQYSEHEGNDRYLPPNLEILVQKGYLPHDQVLECGETPGKRYFYFGNLTKDMPGSFPVVIETQAPHCFVSHQGKKYYGRVLLLNFQTSFIEKEHVPLLLAQARKALALAGSNDQSLLRATLKKKQASRLLKDVVRWRLKILGVGKK